MTQLLRFQSWIWSDWMWVCLWVGRTFEFPLASEWIFSFHFPLFVTVCNAADFLWCEYTHTSSLARWGIQTAEGICSGYYGASKCVRGKSRTGVKKRENKFQGRLTDITAICHLAPFRIKGLREWSLLSEERAARHCCFLAAVDKLSKA